MILRIRDWEKHFENNRTRELKSLGWVPLPNRQDGDGYTELLDHEDGASHYGAWVALVQVASRCDPRGTLLRGCKKAHNSATLSRMTRIPEPILKTAIERLIEIGWLEIISPEDAGINDVTEMSHPRATLGPHPGAGIPQEGAALEERKKERIEGKEKKRKEPVSEISFPEILDFDDFRAAWKNYTDYRAERGFSRLQARSVISQFEAMAGWGREVAIASINESIRNGWQGIFEHGKSRANHRSATDPTRIKSDATSEYDSLV